MPQSQILWDSGLKDAMAGANVIGATIDRTQTTASVYDASISEIEVRIAKLEKDRQRYANLVERKAVAPIQLEQIETELQALQKRLEATERQRKAAVSGVLLLSMILFYTGIFLTRSIHIPVLTSR